MHNFRIIIFSLTPIFLLFISLDLNACTSFLLPPEAICKEKNPIFSEGFKGCYFQLLELTEEEYRNTYDPCLNNNAIGIIDEDTYVDKKTADYIYVNLLKQEYAREVKKIGSSDGDVYNSP